MTHKQVIKIPKGIKYIGELKDFELRTGILSKGVTGCGVTTYALLQDPMSVILLVPRISLLLNKTAQTPDAQPVYGEIETKEITDYIDRHQTSRKAFICTWDSAPRLRRLLNDSWDGYRLVIDEFHVLLSDAAFKAYVDQAFIEVVLDAKYQTWVSATPCLDEFVERMPHLKDLPYYQLEWEDREKVEIQKVYCKKPINALGQIIKMYQQGEYPTLMDDEGNVIEQSKTMNAFFSSVNGILTLVQEYNLTPQDCDIICSDKEDNQEALRKKGFEVGKIPLKGEPRKMFTLATSTAYQGMDFYGEDTSTFVIADSRRPNTSIDISTELIQICGRERMETNPFRKTVVFIHNTHEGKVDIDKKLKVIRKKHEISRKEMEYFNKGQIDEELKCHLIEIIQVIKKVCGDKYDYTYWDEVSGKFSMNDLSQLSDEYRMRVQYAIYHDGAFVLKNIEEQSQLTVKDRGCWVVAEQVKNVVIKTTFAEKMEQYCIYRQQTMMENFMASYFVAQLERQNETLRVYYDKLGPERIKALGYKEKNLQEALNTKKKDCHVRIVLDKAIKKVGCEHTAQEWKAILNKVYEHCGINKKAVCTNLEQYGYKMIKHHRSGNLGKRFYTYEIIL